MSKSLSLSEAIEMDKDARIGVEDESFLMTRGWTRMREKCARAPLNPSVTVLFTSRADK